MADKYCPPNCRLCIDSFPQKALDGTTVDQWLCRKVSSMTNARGFDLYDCNVCRRICPNRGGVKRNTSKR